MSLKKENLQNLLLDHFKLSIDPVPTLSWAELKKSPWREEATEIYQELGGQFESPPCFPAPWHIELDGNIAIQLDEQLHFNKYRSVTLRSSLYKEKEPPFQLVKYQNYCRKQAGECLKSGMAGNLWTNHEAEKQFGPAEAPGDLTGKGAPAWKLRAFQDFLQDLTPQLFPVKLIRLSIYDEILLEKKLVKLNEVLTLPNETSAEVLIKTIYRKLGIAPPPTETA